ncbi:nitrate reductase [Ancylomarina euxinus]|uniref:Nitrate reductase n=1 Tax=Ancylomarina euxinus TaxID=2283627 RepID=A0A425XZU2_9BACT|nr:molybdopterin-dependent oxidoreductase [Ancylomarina euxinus]MCZ4695385.1 molybdopterin-dependent oxidoreductase [Ancylomarina euxinus]MUP15581.1 molybdopterin-dependent oxidoreductase [Ancylomarina euxinus]RRG20975.1 nitrate reductase [Ancylomarina euxinus]
MNSRRQFLKISSLSAAGLIFGGGLLDAFANNLVKTNPSHFKGPFDFTRTPTYCEVCFWKCAGWVYKDENGRIKKIIGNNDDPNCNGRFCPRGTGGVGMYNDEDRLKTPLIRTEERGKQTFREATWDEAFEYIAQKLKKVKSEHGAEAITLFSHGSGGKYFGNLLKAMGSNNITAPSYAQCRGPREVAFISTFGQGINSPENTDIRDTKCLVLIGAHIGENMHNGQVQEMSDAIDKGATIITVDPRFSTAASKSKFWLPIKPATDMALLLTWMNVIINEKLYDKEYVERHCYGFDQLKEHVQQYTPEWAYGVTTLKPQQIRETARAMANAAPAVIVHPGRHVTWYGDDTQRLRAVAILNALLGSWGRRGGYYNPDKAHVPHYKLPDFPKPNKSWRDALGGKYNLADLALASGLCDASMPSHELGHKIKAWIVNGTNLINTLPNQAKTIEAIQALDLIAVVDTMPMEITGYADVVLPECTYLERYDSLRVSQGREPSVALRMPAVEPQYNTKPAYWMARELAKKLDLLDYFPFETLEEEIDWELQQIGSSLEEMQKIGVKRMPREEDDLYFTEGENVEFGTNTGKIELYSTALAEEGFEPMPVYTQHPEPQEGFYRLIYGRAPMHTFSRTANNPNLTDLMDENTLWVNPKVAKEWGLKNDQYVYLENQDGIISDFSIKVRVTERIRFDSVYMVHGFGHTDKRMKRCFGKGVSDTQLISNVMTDPIMGGTGMRGNFVTFRFDNKKEA